MTDSIGLKAIILSMNCGNCVVECYFWDEMGPVGMESHVCKDWKGSLSACPHCGEVF